MKDFIVSLITRGISTGLITVVVVITADKYLNIPFPAGLVGGMISGIAISSGARLLYPYIVKLSGNLKVWAPKYAKKWSFKIVKRIYGQI